MTDGRSAPPTPSRAAADGLTPEQALAATATGSVAVVAGAGTGKTKMLAHRYLHHVESGLSPLEVVAATFTEKAADELRSRIRALFRDARPFDRRSLVELEAAQIGTIHALAARVCRDHPEEAGVAPDFKVLDDVDGVLWQVERIDRVIATLPEEVVAAVPVYVLRTLLPALLSDQVRAEAALEHGPEQWRSLLAAEQEAAYERIAGDPRWRSWRSTLSTGAADPADKAEASRRLCLEALDALDARDPARALQLVGAVSLRGGSVKSWPGGELPLVKDAMKELRSAVQAECGKGVLSVGWSEADDLLGAALPHLRSAYGAAASALEAWRREERVMGFADLELHALRALGHGSVREHYRRRWKALLVDEFQDTSPVQARILSALSEGAKITVVGDEKQSIYGFRGADVGVFRRFRDAVVAGGGAEVVLTSTFRTHGGLTAMQDGVFSELLGELHQPLTAVRNAPAPDASYLEFHAAVGKGNAGVRRLNEAYLVADLIAGMVERREHVVDPETGRSRPARFGDFAVLARGSAPFDTFAAVLPARGVPALEVAGGDLLGTREAKDGEAVIRLLADRNDAVALAAVLRSPFFAVDDASLLAAALRLEEGRPWWEGLADASEEGELGRAMTTLRSLVESRGGLGPSRSLQALDQATGYSAVVANLPGGRRRLADWRGFLGLVRQLEGASEDAFGVSRALRRVRAAQVDIARPPLQAGDAVTLTTIHKSKGLEWPVVIVADLSYQGAADETSFAIDPERGLGFRPASDDGPLAPVVLRLIGLAKARAAEEEGRRLLYVALTRARDRLFLTASERERGNLALLEPALAATGIECRELPIDPTLSYPDPPLPGPSDHGLSGPVTDG